jgi:hypothetical protein
MYVPSFHTPQYLNSLMRTSKSAMRWRSGFTCASTYRPIVGRKVFRNQAPSSSCVWLSIEEILPEILWDH